MYLLLYQDNFVCNSNTTCSYRKIFFILRTFRIFFFAVIITELKFIKSIIRSSVLIAGISGLFFLSMLDGKNGKNVMVFDLVFEDKDFLYDGVLLVCQQLDGGYIVARVISLMK